MSYVQAITTENLLHLRRRAEETNRNRSVYTDSLAKDIDPSGTHLVAFRIPHNDVEWRCLIFVKLRNTMTPARIWLDISFEDARCIRQREVKELSPLEQLGLASLG